MRISAAERRSIDALGIAVPPIVFGSAGLANLPSVIPEQRKLAICGEWFRHVQPPVFVDVAYKHGDGMAVEVLGRMLRRLEITSGEVVVHLALDANRVVEFWEKSCRLLGDEYRPKLLSVVDADEHAWREASDLKAAGLVRGIGVVTKDVRAVTSLVALPDWTALSGGFSLMRHPPEVLSGLAEVAGRRIPIVLAGVFDAGFLVGSNRLDGRVLDTVDPANRSLFAWRTSFAALCHGHGVKPAHACIQFALSAPGVFAVRLDSSHPDRVSENADSVLQKVPAAFWDSMREEGLLRDDYPHLGT